MTKLKAELATVSNWFTLTRYRSHWKKGKKGRYLEKVQEVLLEMKILGSKQHKEESKGINPVTDQIGLKFKSEEELFHWMHYTFSLLVEKCKIKTFEPLLGSWNRSAPRNVTPLIFSWQTPRSKIYNIAHHQKVTKNVHHISDSIYLIKILLKIIFYNKLSVFYTNKVNYFMNHT